MMLLVTFFPCCCCYEFWLPFLPAAAEAPAGSAGSAAGCWFCWWLLVAAAADAEGNEVLAGGSETAKHHRPKGRNDL